MNSKHPDSNLGVHRSREKRQRFKNCGTLARGNCRMYKRSTYDNFLKISTNGVQKSKNNSKIHNFMNGRLYPGHVNVEYSGVFELPVWSAPGTYKKKYFCIFQYLLQSSPSQASDETRAFLYTSI